MSSVLHAAKQPATPAQPAVKTIEQEHEDLVRGTKKNPEELMAQMTPQKMDALHMAVGIAGEGGEVLDAVKKWVIYNQPLDADRLASIVKELGDIEYYLRGLRMAIGVSRDEILHANLVKLRKRYPGEKYTDAAAKARADGEPEFSQVITREVITGKEATTKKDWLTWAVEVAREKQRQKALGLNAADQTGKDWNTAGVASQSGQANLPANSGGQPIDSSRC